jgi:hypothetical protein
MKTEGPWGNYCFGNSETRGVIGEAGSNFGLNFVEPVAGGKLRLVEGASLLRKEMISLR